MISDIGMTDYSSWAYDFVLTRRPLFIYASDLDEYNNERGLYYPLESTPFPVAENNEMLLNNVRQFDDVAYHEWKPSCRIRAASKTATRQSGSWRS